MPALALIAAFPWLVGAARGVWAWARGVEVKALGELETAGDELESLERDDLARAPLDAQAVAALDGQAREALEATGVHPIASLAIDPATVQAAAASFRSVTPGIPDAVLRLLLAQTHLESSFGKGWGEGCWNMGAEQCPGGQPGVDFTCIDHADTHADGSTYHAGYKCFASQQAAAAGYLRLLAADRYAAAYAGAQAGDALGFVQGLFSGGWFEGVGATPEIRWGKYLAGVLARLPGIDAGLAQDGGAAARVAGVGLALAVAGGAAVAAAGAGYGAWRLFKSAAPAAASSSAVASSAALPLLLRANQAAPSRAAPAAPPAAPSRAAPAAPPPSRTAPAAPPAPSPKARGGGGRPAAAPAAAPPGARTWTPQERADDEASWNAATAKAEAQAGIPHDAQQLDQADAQENEQLPAGFDPPPGASANRGLETLPDEGGAAPTIDADETPAEATPPDATPADDSGETAPTDGDSEARVAGVGQGMGGLMLAAVLNGQALNTDAWVEVEVPVLDLVITVPRRAFRAHVDGYPDPLLLGISYADQIEMCRSMGWISLTWEMVDAIWRAPFTWQIEPVGQWVPGADIASLAFAQRHTATVDAAVAQLDQAAGAPPDAVVRPEGKAWILHERLPTSKGAVLWGWQKRNGTPLQGFGFGHNAEHVDYSMCEAPAQRMARRLSTGEAIDLLDWYRGHFPDPAMRPFLDAYEG